MTDHAEFWNDGQGGTYASVHVNGARDDHMALDSGSFQTWLHGAYYKAHGTAPRELPVETLKCRALYDSAMHSVATRVAFAGGKLYVDNVGPHGECLEVCPVTDGVPWRTVTTPPVRFLRPTEQRALPMPEDGGVLAEFRDLMNASDDGFYLTVGFMVAVLKPDLECPLLCISGGQGSGKTKLTAMVRDLVDPREPCMSSLPGTPQDLAVMCNSAHVLACDNGSRITDRMSDAFCQMVSGTGAIEGRKLYTNGELSVVKARRGRIILNGIPQLAERPDLADRVLSVKLTPLSEGNRLTEEALRSRFDEVKRRVFGVILKGVASALAGTSTKPARMPRMADWALYVTAAESGLGLPSGSIVAAFWRARSDAVDSVLEASVTATAILNLRDACTKRGERTWEGTLGALLTKLRTHAPDGAERSPKWPRHEKGLADALHRESPMLSDVGVHVEKLGKRRIVNGGRNVWRLAFLPAADGEREVAADHVTTVPAACGPVDGTTPASEPPRTIRGYSRIDANLG